MINSGGNLNGLVSDIIRDTGSMISGKNIRKKQSAHNYMHVNNSMGQHISMVMHMMNNNTSDIENENNVQSKEQQEFSDDFADTALEKNKKEVKKEHSDKIAAVKKKPDKECEDDCFCTDDLDKSRLKLSENERLNKDEYKRKQLRNAFIMSEVLSEPVCKKRHKR